MAYREFTDQAGVRWRAWDTYPSSVSNVRSVYAAGWLGFESDGERRRLHPVPAGWADASDGELWEMLREAVPIAVRPAEQLLDHARPTSTGSGPPSPSSESEQTSSALMDATRAVVERARSVLNAVSSTLAQTRSDDDRK